jgi:hypothetical protein
MENKVQKLRELLKTKGAKIALVWVIAALVLGVAFFFAPGTQTVEGLAVPAEDTVLAAYQDSEINFEITSEGISVDGAVIYDDAASGDDDSGSGLDNDTSIQTSNGNEPGSDRGSDSRNNDENTANDDEVPSPGNGNASGQAQQNTPAPMISPAPTHVPTTTPAPTPIPTPTPAQPQHQHRSQLQCHTK